LQKKNEKRIGKKAKAGDKRTGNKEQRQISSPCCLLPDTFSRSLASLNCQRANKRKEKKEKRKKPIKGNVLCFFLPFHSSLV
jgi:hypothetical protein